MLHQQVSGIQIWQADSRLMGKFTVVCSLLQALKLRRNVQNIIRPGKDSAPTAQKLTVRPVQGSAAGHTYPDLKPGWIFHPSPDGSNQNVLIMLHGYGDTAGKPPLLAAEHSVQVAGCKWAVPQHISQPLHISGCSSASCNSLPFGLSADAFAKLGQKLELPQTAVLAITGSLPVPGTEKGRAWFLEDHPVSCSVGRRS